MQIRYITSNEYAALLNDPAIRSGKGQITASKGDVNPTKGNNVGFQVTFDAIPDTVFIIRDPKPSVFDKAPRPWKAISLILADANDSEIVHLGTSGDNKFTPPERELIVKEIVKAINSWEPEE